MKSTLAKAFYDRHRAEIFGMLRDGFIAVRVPVRTRLKIDPVDDYDVLPMPYILFERKPGGVWYQDVLMERIDWKELEGFKLWSGRSTG